MILHNLMHIRCDPKPKQYKWSGLVCQTTYIADGDGEYIGKSKKKKNTKQQMMAKGTQQQKTGIWTEKKRSEHRGNESMYSDRTFI